MISKKLLSLLLVFIMMLPVVPSMSDSLEVPELDSLYSGVSVKLNGSTNEAIRIFAYYGPGKDYFSAHGYKPYKQLGITAYYSEGGWVLIHLKYKTAKERFLYMADSAFKSLGGLTTVTQVQYYTGKTISAAQPRLGPADSFISEENLRNIPSGTDLKVFFQKNGYMFAEFVTSSGNARMWIPASCVKITGTSSYTPAQRTVFKSKLTQSQGAGQNSSEYQDVSETYRCYCGGIMTGKKTTAYLDYSEQVHHYGPVVIFTCQSCGNQQFEGGDAVYDEPHSYVNNICSKCGHQKNSSIRCPDCGGDMILQDWLGVSTPVDGSTHRTEHYLEYECQRCYNKSGRQYLDPVIESHVWDGDRCHYCGYVDPGD